MADISAGGARLEVPETIDLPDDFDIFIPARSETRIARIRRRTGSAVGVQFLKSRLEDPLVIQTLLERVSCLERGHAGPRSSGPPAAREPSADRGADIDALKRETQELARAMRGISAPVPSAVGVEDVAALKAEVARLGATMRELASTMQETIQETIQETMQERSGQGEPGVGRTAEPADTGELAKLRAEMSELRAQTSGAPPLEAAAEIAQLRDDINALRGTMQGLILLVSKALGVRKAA